MYLGAGETHGPVEQASQSSTERLPQEAIHAINLLMGFFPLPVTFIAFFKSIH